jgi:hypothetical protein
MPCLCRQFIILYNLMFVTVLLLKFRGKFLFELKGKGEGRGPLLLLDPLLLRVLRGVSLRDLSPGYLTASRRTNLYVSRILSYPLRTLYQPRRALHNFIAD